MRDDFTKFSTIYQWFQTLIYPALMQRPQIKVQDIAHLGIVGGIIDEMSLVDFFNQLLGTHSQ